MKQSTKKKTNKKNEDVTYLCGGIMMVPDEIESLLQSAASISKTELLG